MSIEFEILLFGLLLAILFALGSIYLEVVRIRKLLEMKGKP